MVGLCHHLWISQKCDFLDSRSVVFPDWTNKSSPQFSYSPNHYCEETINNLRSLFTKSTPQIVCTPHYFCGNTITNLRGIFRLWTHQPRDPQVILMWSQVRPSDTWGCVCMGAEGGEIQNTCLLIGFEPFVAHTRCQNRPPLLPPQS
jgi:hypothetical protein